MNALAFSWSYSQLFVGGAFGQVLLSDGSPVPGTANLAAWNVWSQQWQSVGNGVNSWVHALALGSGGSQLFLGGRFTQAGSAPNTTYIAGWNVGNQTWFPLQNGLNGYVFALALSGDQLYAGGEFTASLYDASSQPLQPLRPHSARQAPAYSSSAYIARYDFLAQQWFSMQTGTNNFVYALAFDFTLSQLYVGGDFTQAGFVSTGYLARWDTATQQFFALGCNASGFWSGPVRALVYDARLNQLDIGGEFAPSYVMTWSIFTQFGSLGTGTNATVRALALDATSNLLYAGGDFILAGSAPAFYIAVWNGTAWAPLQGGTNGQVNALATEDGAGVWAGGAFTQAINTGNVTQALNVAAYF